MITCDKVEVYMSFFHLFVLAVIQGLTEFLPVSSSAHLALFPALTGANDQGLAIDVAVHVGTLAAVIFYFWKEVRLAIGGVQRLLSGKMDTPGSRLAFLLFVATIPVVILGFLFSVFGIDEMLRSVKVIAWAMILFGILLYVADKRGSAAKEDAEWNLADAIRLGLWQAIALIPGTSRSGITITGALFLGYKREDAARIAMLMSIPTIAASGALQGFEVVASGQSEILKEGAIAAILSCLAALLALSVMMRLLKTVSFTPYVVYRLALGGALLWFAYS